MFQTFITEAERALLEVEGRDDEPHRRVALDDCDPFRTSQLRLAIAELADAYPCIYVDLETLSDRLQASGTFGASEDLCRRPHLLQLVRLSLEVFFRDWPTPEDYEMYLRDEDVDGCDDDDCSCAGEVWDAHRSLLQNLKAWTC